MPVYSHPPPDLRARLETQVDFLNQVSHHAFDTVEQLSDLNMHMARQLLDDGIRLGRALAACNDPLQMGAVAMREIAPTAEGWRNWHSSLMSVLTASGATLARDANDGSRQAARGAASATRPGVEDMGAAHNPT